MERLEQTHAGVQPADEVSRRRQWAEAGGGSEAVRRQHAVGRFTIRERIARLIDPGTFQEVGKLTGTASYDEHGSLLAVVPAPYVMGLAKIGSRDVAVGGEDFTVHGGSSWGSQRRKGGQGGFIEDLAANYRIPLINLIDGAGGSVESIRRRGHAVFPGVHGFERSVELLGIVPVVSAVLGVAAGGPAGRAILSHWSVMVRGSSQIFAAGPPVVKRALGREISTEELGGAHIAVDTAGTIDDAVDSEDEAIEMVKRFLSYMPQNVWELPARAEPKAPPAGAFDELACMIPANRRQPYDMHRLVACIVDEGSVLELLAGTGRSLIAILARIDGQVVGILANNPRVLGGAMDAAAGRKQARFVGLCDTFNIPLLYLVDQPGFMVGESAERGGTLREGMRAVYAGLTATVPAMTVVVRKCYGMAGMAMCDKGGLNFKVAWASAEIGNLPMEGGVRAAFKREIERAPDPEGRQREIEEELRGLMSPFRMAEAFALEDVIDPRETRSYVGRFLEASRHRLSTNLGPKTRSVAFL